MHWLRVSRSCRTCPAIWPLFYDFLEYLRTVSRASVKGRPCERMAFEVAFDKGSKGHCSGDVPVARREKLSNELVDS